MNDSSAPWLDGISGDSLPPLIESDAKVIRVVAGPGSGKTTGLKRRIQRLRERDGVDHSKIFVGTFTRAIANDLAEELGEEIKVSTLHSLALQLLREHPAALGGLKIRFLLAYEEDVMLYDIAPEVPHLTNQTERQKALNRQQSARAERSRLPDAKFAGAVDRWLRRHGGMLIGEVVYYAAQGLKAGDIPRGEYDHVVVDEYQDLTAVEQELVELIWSGEGSLVVLGDNDQSIYSFRYNHPGGIDEFKDRWDSQGLQDLSIPENRRCGEQIVDLANSMMAEAGSSKPPMDAKSGRQGDLTILTWPTQSEEIAGLAAWINSKPNESFLVMVTRRFIGHRLKDLIEHGARTAFHQEVLENSVVRERFAAASVLGNPEDRVALRAWLGFFADKPDSAPARNAAAYASLATTASASSLAQSIAAGNVEEKGAGTTNVLGRANAMVNLETTLMGKSVKEQIEALFDPAYAEAFIEDPEKLAWAQADLLTLRQAALGYISDQSSLGDVISILRYRIATRAPLIEDNDEPRVRIMTLHSAKGLQGDNIILAGAADQLIPGLEGNQQKREEQRRLLYVAVTRAKSSLIVSSARGMAFEDAMQNAVRRDGVFTLNGKRLCRLSRCTLLPQSLGSFTEGSTWLASKGL